MLTDSFFVQGCTHEVCEDFALEGENYAIISDGCSNGGGPRIHTDFGSRLLSKAAEEHLDSFESSETFLQCVSATARTQQRTFPNLPDSCLTATLMTLKEVKNEYKALAVGDGIVGGKKKNGQWVVHVIEFPNGGPFYLKYQIFNEVSQWKTQFGGRYKIKTYTGDILSSGLDFPEWIESSPPNLAQRIDQWLEVIEYREKICDFDENSPYNQFVFPKDEFEFAFVASDGLESFYIPVKTRKSKYNQPVFVLDVLRVLLNFVTIRPGFARLQSNWMFRQDKNGTFKRRNWLNGDDVSLGIIHD